MPNDSNNAAEAPPANKHDGRYTKQARMVRDGHIGITISGTEYVMPISEAWELIALIYRATHDGVQL